MTEIDVERLARALHQAYCKERRLMHSDQLHSAEAIARIYGLLAPSPSTLPAVLPVMTNAIAGPQASTPRGVR